MATELTLPSPALPSSSLADNLGERRLTRATTDLEAVAGWLSQYLDSRHTFISYRKEADRLLMYLASRGLTLPFFKVEDVSAYRAFLADPLPRERWCLQLEPRTLGDGSPNPAWRQVQRISRKLPDGSPNPAWRPFVSGLSESAVNQAMTVLFGLFEYLAAIQYLSGNPFRAARRRRKHSAVEIERYFDHETFQELMALIEELPRETARQEAHYRRTRFAVAFLYLSGFRREEFCNARASDLIRRRGKWWIRVTGKGNKAGLAPLNQSALAELKAYRSSLGLSELPEPDDAGPLLRDITGKREIGVKALHQLLTTVFRKSANPQLRRGSAHWLRHTAATHMLDAGIELAEVRDTLRHANIATTSRYVHTGQDRRHESSEQHHLP